MVALLVIFTLSAFIVIYAMIGYPLLLKLLDNILKPNEIPKNEQYEPTVTYMIVAHNEEAVISKKLDNALNLEYPREKFQILVASDNSSDSTNEIVQEYIKNYPDREIVLYCSREHKGKTNAQNEAQKEATGEILVFTDANTLLHADAIRQLIHSSFGKAKENNDCPLGNSLLKRIEVTHGETSVTSIHIGTVRGVGSDRSIIPLPRRLLSVWLC